MKEKEDEEKMETEETFQGLTQLSRSCWLQDIRRQIPFCAIFEGLASTLNAAARILREARRRMNRKRGRGGGVPSG
jgi:hypothetical protein